MNKLMINDEIIVLAGKEKDKKGKVKAINRKRNRVFVDDVNIVKKAVKPTQADPNGGIKDVEASLHISNIAVVSPKTGKATRVKIERRDGKNTRIAVSCGTVLNNK